jgi:hypothetical protein
MKEKIRSIFANRWMLAAALAVALYALLGFFVLPRRTAQEDIRCSSSVITPLNSGIL